MLLHDEIDNVAYLTYLLAIRWEQQCLESMADDVVSATMVCFIYINVQYTCTHSQGLQFLQSDFEMVSSRLVSWVLDGGRSPI